MPCAAHGLMTWIGARWPSTWSTPAWLSSSTTKIAESFQYLLCEIVVDDLADREVAVGDLRARGVDGPPVWSLESQSMWKLAGPFFSKSCFQIWYAVDVRDREVERRGQSGC